MSGPCGRRMQPRHRNPEHIRVDQECGYKVGGEPVLADVRIVHEAALDHVPAEDALQSAEYEHQQVLRPLIASNISFRQKVDERQQKNYADNSAQQTVQEFQPENILEGIDVHLRIQFLKFGRLLVHLEHTLPLAVCDRWQPAHERSPVDHGQA